MYKSYDTDFAKLPEITDYNRIEKINFQKNFYMIILYNRVFAFCKLNFDIKKWFEIFVSSHFCFDLTAN